MYKHWQLVLIVAKVLVWRALRYDNDGMEMYFTRADTQPVLPTPNQGLDVFLQAMEKAKPKHSDAGGAQTNMYPVLDRIMNDFTMQGEKNNARKKTILVLTDGRWEAMSPDDQIDKAIQTRFGPLVDKYMKEVQKDLAPNCTRQDCRYEAIKRLERKNCRPLTIQFIRFGHDRKAISRLNRLDNDLCMESPGYP